MHFLSGNKISVDFFVTWTIPQFLSWQTHNHLIWEDKVLNDFQR